MKGKWGKRRRYVYAYDVLDVRDMHIKIGYVGKSSSVLVYRDTQHRASKDWAWAIKGNIRLVWGGDCGRISLWFREIYYIKKLHPLFNVEWNKNNPHRIAPWIAHKLYGIDRPKYAYRG